MILWYDNYSHRDFVSCAQKALWVHLLLRTHSAAEQNTWLANGRQCPCGLHCLAHSNAASVSVSVSVGVLEVVEYGLLPTRFGATPTTCHQCFVV